MPIASARDDNSRPPDCPPVRRSAGPPVRRSAGPPATIGPLRDYVLPQQRIVVCPKQDVGYGFGMLDAHAGPSVLQVPDLEDRLWAAQLVDQHTEAFERPGSRTPASPATA
ncbi:DUF1254 domain-containing protein [Streptomyces sp. NPDC048462]|uniref:DUF1254 domain-containing protein n=1 Tax=Streptomyces sp. NPDC048462 TaxID=3365555 RepID=UPI003715B7B4